jgi:NAD-dependent DNA ligase
MKHCMLRTHIYIYIYMHWQRGFHHKAKPAVQILQLPACKEKKVDNLLTAIEKSRQGSAALLLSSLGIPGLGKQLAALLMRHFGSIEVWPQPEG